MSVKFIGQTEKVCTSCKVLKPIESFRKYFFKTKGYDCIHSHCRQCNAESSIIKKYGLSLPQYYKMHKECNSTCELCGTHVDDMPRNKKYKFTGLCVDHCHTTGKIRGLLCLQCNSMLGQAKDNIATLETAIQYLRKHS